MAALTYTAEGGSDEVNVSTTPFGGDAFDLVGANPPKYDTAQAAHGSVSMRCDATSTGYAGWDSAFAASDDDHGRMYLRVGTPSVAAIAIGFWTVGGGSIRISLEADGKISLRDKAGITNPSSMALTNNQWYRLEWHMVRHASAGSQECKIFDFDSTTVLETVSWTGRDTGSSSMIDFTFGNNTGGGSMQAWFDDIVTQATSYPGPAAAEVPNIGATHLLMPLGHG